MEADLVYTSSSLFFFGLFYGIYPDIKEGKSLLDIDRINLYYGEAIKFEAINAIYC